MKYFVRIKLSKARVNELVYADGPKDAEAIARANITNLLDEWNETFLSAEVISFYELGQMACEFHPDITYSNAGYYYVGRRIDNDNNFMNGFANSFSANQVERELEDAILYEAIDEKQT